MNIQIETPPALRGEPEQQLRQISGYLFRLAETLNVELDRVGNNSQGDSSNPGINVSAREVRELRELISKSALELLKAIELRVTQEQLTSAVEAALRVAEESGDFDGNGIASAVLNQDYTLTFRFTDGTSYTTPSIRGAQGEGFEFQIGDVYTTTREGDAADLLGYGIWEETSSGSIRFWTRIS